jgi:hypothetical protein
MSKSDILKNLPTDETPPNNSEIQIVEQFFTSEKNSLEKIFSGIKDVLIVCLIFIIFCLPQFNSIVYKIFPSAEKSEYMLILIKTGLFGLSYFIIKNMYLVRK